MPAGFSGGRYSWTHGSSSLFLPFLERLDRKVAVSGGLLHCVVQSCCESASILSKSFECHMLGVWRTLHRCQSSHFPRDSVVTYLFKIQSPSLLVFVFEVNANALLQAIVGRLQVATRALASLDASEEPRRRSMIRCAESYEQKHNTTHLNYSRFI